MWPVSIFISVVVHAILFLSIGMQNGGSVVKPAKAFSLIEFSTPASDVLPDKGAAANFDGVTGAAISSPTTKPLRAKRSATLSTDENLSIEQPSPPFYKSSQVSHVAQLQLPLEGVSFSDELSLSGRLVLDISVTDKGKVVNIDVIEVSDVSGALRARMLPLLRDGPFTPAYKDGKPVNSVRRVEFTLGHVIGDPALGFNSSVSPGFRPQMDERGNILKVQPKQ